MSTAPSGLVTDAQRNPDGTRSVARPDGTEASRRDVPDPRFGMLAPLVQIPSVTTPSGLVSSVTRTRSAVPRPSGSGVASQLDTLTVNGRSYTDAYDGTANTLLRTTPGGRTSSTALDLLGRVSSLATPGLAPEQRSYDARGRLETITLGSGPSARVTNMGYDAAGRLAAIIDPLGRTTSLEYDAANRVSRQVLPDGREVLFDYDANGNLTSLAPSGRTPHVFRYTFGNVESEYEPPAIDAGDPRTLYSYDIDRRLDFVLRPDGTTVDLAYDFSDRLESLTTPTGTIAYGYDANTGNLSSITAPGGQDLALAYDGALPTATTWSGAVSGSVARSFDADFRIETETVGGTPPIAFDYDADGLLTGAGVLAITRDADTGLVLGTALGSTTTTETPNAFGELEAHSAQVGATTAFAESFARDLGGRITERSETIGGVTTLYAYHYDAAGRLDEVRQNGAVAASYSYDANGNRLSLTTPTSSIAGSYDAQDRLASYGTKTYAYTRAGELASQTDTATAETTTYGYDALGNLRSVALPDGRNLAYVIDGESRRVGKRVDGTLQKGWLYGDALRIVAETDGSGAVLSRFVYGAKPNVPEYMIRGGTTYRIFSDPLGSPRLVVHTGTGAIAQRLDYDAFGNVTQDTSPGFQPFGFAGGLYDADTKLVRFGARDYDAAVGRWTSKDLIRFEGGDSNLYGYVVMDPLNNVDPKGAELVGAAIGGTLGFAAGGIVGAINGAGFWRGALGGAAGGFVGGLTFNPALATLAAEGVAGASLFAGAASGAAGGFAQGLAQELFDAVNPSAGFDSSAIGFSTFAGAITGLGLGPLAGLNAAGLGTPESQLVEGMFGVGIPIFEYDAERLSRFLVDLYGQAACSR